MPNIVLERIVIYPVKSLSGIEVLEANVESRGIERDRRWMIISDDFQFVTQRKHSKLHECQVSIEQGEVFVSAEQSKIQLSIATPRKEVEVGIWGDQCSALLATKKANDWISNFLGFNAYFVYMHEDSNRPLEAKANLENGRVSFADGYPVLTLSLKSMELLNDKMEVPLPIDRFRPNLIISGTSEAHQEDTWESFHIGSTHFRGVKKCARCVFTTINQSTGEKAKEPLFTLSKYRKENNKIYFGMNTVIMKEGRIQKGDIIHIKSTL